MDVTSSIRSNVYAQSVVITRTMDFWGRTAGISAILPYVDLDASSNSFSASNQGVSDVGFLLQTNISEDPRDEGAARSFVPETFASFHLAVTTPLKFRARIIGRLLSDDERWAITISEINSQLASPGHSVRRPGKPAARVARSHLLPYAKSRHVQRSADVAVRDRLRILMSALMNGSGFQRPSPRFRTSRSRS